MDPLSITTACIGLVSTITKTSIQVAGFVKDVRAARNDLDCVSGELLSLKTVLELLAEDFTEFTRGCVPQTITKQITGIIKNCSGVVIDIEEELRKHEDGTLNKAAHWVAFERSNVMKLQTSLKAHKSALDIALEMITLFVPLASRKSVVNTFARTVAREIKADTVELLNDTSAIKEDTAQILVEIARLQKQLPKGREPHLDSRYMLERYLDNLSSYAGTIIDRLPYDESDCGADDIDPIVAQADIRMGLSRSTCSSNASSPPQDASSNNTTSFEPWQLDDRKEGYLLDQKRQLASVELVKSDDKDPSIPERSPSMSPCSDSRKTQLQPARPVDESPQRNQRKSVQDKEEERSCTMHGQFPVYNDAGWVILKNAIVIEVDNVSADELLTTVSGILRPIKRLMFYEIPGGLRCIQVLKKFLRSKSLDFEILLVRNKEPNKSHRQLLFRPLRGADISSIQAYIDRILKDLEGREYSVHTLRSCRPDSSVFQLTKDLEVDHSAQGKESNQHQSQHQTQYQEQL